MLEELKQKVYEANMQLPKYGLVTFTWGNVSAIDREKGLFVIKPSGVDYDKMKTEDMVVMDLEGNQVEGKLNPSSDTKTHLVLYNRFPMIGGIVHTHSPWATSWAQAGRDIPCYGTTHADYIYGAVPCARNLTEEELKDYERNTGVLIADLFEERKLDPVAVPCVLCKNHGPFTWGKDAAEAVHNAVVLEEVAKMAARCERLNPDVKEAPKCLQDKHYLRKHGPGAYYGQRKCYKNYDASVFLVVAGKTAVIRIISKFVQYPVKGCWANIIFFHQSVDHIVDGGMFCKALAEQIGERGLGSNALVPGIAPGLMAQVQAPYRVFYHIGYHFTGS